VNDLPSFNLLDFIPFRILRLAARVGDPFEAMFHERFGFELPEWRVLNVVAQSEPCAAHDIAEQTGMHKSRVSRAVGDLTRLELMVRVSATQDRRELHLKLTTKGRRVYREAVALALEREAALMSGLSLSDRRRLESLVRKLEGSLGLQTTPRNGKS